MTKKKSGNNVFKEGEDAIKTIVFVGMMPNVKYLAKADELSFKFNLEEPIEQLEALAELTDDPRNVLKTMKAQLKHNGVLEIPIEKKDMRGKFYDASNSKVEEIMCSEPLRPEKVVLKTFIIDKPCEAYIVYKGPRDLQEHKKLAQHADHKMNLHLSIPQSLLPFESGDEE